MPPAARQIERVARRELSAQAERQRLAVQYGNKVQMHAPPPAQPTGGGAGSPGRPPPDKLVIARSALRAEFEQDLGARF